MYKKGSFSTNWRDDFDELKTRFKRIAIVGKGTYGCVYKAHPIGEPHKIYALKKIQLYKEKDGFPLTSLREIKILQNLDHKNIVKLHSIINSKKSTANNYRRSTFMVMEYMEHDFVSLLPNVNFRMREIKCLMKQLLEGLDYIHSKKIIHRDIKSGNLLMNNKGEIKICDFGLARYYYNFNMNLTQNVVTFWYRAPELIFGETKYTNKIDVWSVGCIFAELLTKKVLFNGKEIKDQMELMYQKLGYPDESWPEVKNLKFYNDLRPRKLYAKTLSRHIKERCPEADENCLHLLELMLAFNPENRVSARSALNHPFFHTHPLPCKPHEMRVLDKEYHDYMIRESNPILLMKLIVKYKKKLERYNAQKRELEKNKEEEKNKPWNKMQGISNGERKRENKNRLLGLFGLSKKSSNAGSKLHSLVGSKKTSFDGRGSRSTSPEKHSNLRKRAPERPY